MLRSLKNWFGYKSTMGKPGKSPASRQTKAPPQRRHTRLCLEELEQRVLMTTLPATAIALGYSVGSTGLGQISSDIYLTFAGTPYLAYNGTATVESMLPVNGGPQNSGGVDTMFLSPGGAYQVYYSPTGLAIGGGASLGGGTYAVAKGVEGLITPNTSLGAYSNFNDIELFPTVLSGFNAGGTFGSKTFTVPQTAVPGSFTYSYSGTLPKGIQLNSSTGVLSGAAATDVAGTYTFTVEATNTGVHSLGALPNLPDQVVTQVCTLTVKPAAASKLIVSASPTSTTVGSPITVTVTAQDPYGNVATNLSSVQLSSSETNTYNNVPNSMFAGTTWPVTLKSGYGSLTLTPVHSGTVTFKATAGAINATSNSVVVAASMVNYVVGVDMPFSYYNVDGIQIRGMNGEDVTTLGTGGKGGSLWYWIDFNELDIDQGPFTNNLSGQQTAENYAVSAVEGYLATSLGLTPEPGWNGEATWIISTMAAN
jgi:hypothetical protein